MRNSAGLCLHAWWIAGFLAAPLAGQTPTFSVELVEINSVAIAGNGVNRMSVAPGDMLTVHFFVRDFSPEGQMIAAYQAELAHNTFNSGSSGTIRPVGYEATTLKGLANSTNALIDLSHPRFLHAGLQPMAVTNSSKQTPGYRWISVLLGDRGPVSRQDGAKFYCGTLKLYVSKDADGTFSIDLTPGRSFTGIADFNAESILPVEIEPLTLVVQEDASRLWISSTNPSFGAVDARAASPAAPAWDRFTLNFSTDASSVRTEDLSVEDGSATPPHIQSISTDKKTVLVVLDEPIHDGAWTTITHTPSGTGLRVGRLHGDVNGDGARDVGDLLRLIRTMNDGGSLPLHGADVDGNSVVDAADILGLVELIACETGKELPHTRADRPS